MALIRCSECNREISDKAVSCPSCGCPTGLTVTNAMTDTKVVEKKEVFQVGRSSFVLSEIVALSEFGYRRWLSVTCAIITLVSSLLLFRETWLNGLSMVFCGGVLFVGGIISAVLLFRAKEVATSGGEKSLDAPYRLVLRDYCSRVPDDVLVHYSGKNWVHTMNFVINTDRVARYEFKPAFPILPFTLGMLLVCISPFVLVSEASILLKILVIPLNILFFIIAYHSGRTAIAIAGVGGNIVELHTTRKDAKRIKGELQAKITNLTK